MQRREHPFKFFNASEGQYANNLNPEKPRAQFQVTLIGAGAVLDNGEQQATYYDGEQCTVSALPGYSVTSLAIEGGSTITELPYTFMVSRNTNITVNAIQQKSFADSTWSEIDEVCKAGLAPTMYAVGDEKDIELSTGEIITVLILGFNHDDLSDGSGKAAMTIGMKNVLSVSYKYDENTRGNIGWRDCTLRNDVMLTLFSQLPVDLQNIVKFVNKNNVESNHDWNIVTTEEKLWLLSVAEIYSSTSLKNSTQLSISQAASPEFYIQEGNQYEYYKNLIGDNGGNTDDNPLLVKYLNKSPRTYCFRTVPAILGAGFCLCIYNAGSLLGELETMSVSNNFSISYAFCI